MSQVVKPCEICGLHCPVQIISEFQCSKDPKSFLLQLICRRWNPDEELAHFHKQNQTDTSCLYSYTYNYIYNMYIYIYTHTCSQTSKTNHLQVLECRIIGHDVFRRFLHWFTPFHSACGVLPRPGSVFGELAVIHQANFRVSFQNVQPPTAGF